MSKALMSSERPAGLDELEQEEYPIPCWKSRPSRWMRRPLKFTRPTPVVPATVLYDNWVRESFSALSGLMPGQYNKQEKVAAYVDAIR